MIIITAAMNAAEPGMMDAILTDNAGIAPGSVGNVAEDMIIDLVVAGTVITNKMITVSPYNLSLILKFIIIC